MFMMMAIVRDRMKNSFSKNGFPSSRFLSPAVDPAFVIRGGGDLIQEFSGHILEN